MLRTVGPYILAPDTLEKVLEKLAVTGKATIVVSKESDDKMLVTSGCWDGERDQVLEIRNVERRRHVRAKGCQHDVWDPPIEPYDPYGPGRPRARLRSDTSPMALTHHNSSVTRHPSARRMRALRRRQRAGIRRLSIDFTKAQLDQLEARGYLDSYRRGDRADEIEAVEAFLMDALAKSG